MSLPASLRDRLRLPLIAAPMFLVSGPALVTAACRAGVIGSFPTANCRTVEELDAWLGGMVDDAKRAADTEGRAPAPWCPNLIVHRSNPRVPEDLAAVLRHKAEIVITRSARPTRWWRRCTTSAAWCWPTSRRCGMPRRRWPPASTV
jgi:nitronate monooxygenase